MTQNPDKINSNTSASNDTQSNDFKMPTPTAPRCSISDLKALTPLIKLINKTFSGEENDNLQLFLDKCQTAYSACPDELRESLYIHIRNNIEGEVWEDLRYRTDVIDYPTLKAYLIDTYRPKKSYSQLMCELNICKQENHETTVSYSQRIR